MLNPLFRFAYWVAYRLLCARWYVTRETHTGANVAVWHDGKLLVVRHSYQRGLFLPGGGLEAGESGRDAAVRELREEVGLTVDAAALRLALVSTETVAFRTDTTEIYELELDQPSALRIDGREIVEARFADRAELVRDASSQHLVKYLGVRARSATQPV